MKICSRRDRLLTPEFLGFPCGSAGKESACNAGDLGLIPGLGISSGEGKGCTLQHSGLENSMDCIVHGGRNNSTWLSDFHFHLMKGLWFQRRPRKTNTRSPASRCACVVPRDHFAHLEQNFQQEELLVKPCTLSKTVSWASLKTQHF